VTSAVSLTTAVTFVWLGMVLAISFLEAPLKFRAPGVTVPIGLGIGRLVFRALNIVELILAATLMLGLLVDVPPPRVLVGATVTIGVLLIQVAILRPVLARRSNRVLAGEVVDRSGAHYWYVSLEVAKVGALITTGALLLAL
jgi:hypothetical protein